MFRVSSFTFSGYEVDAVRSIVTFRYRIQFQFGITKTFTDRLVFPDVTPDMWRSVPEAVLTPTLQALHIMIGINYWCVFRSKNIHIEGFTLSDAQAQFWNSLYLNGLAEFFYDMHVDFRDLISFPSDRSHVAPPAARYERRERALLLNGAGKDSILSAELLKQSNMPFDFFSFAPTPAHTKIAALVGARTITCVRRRDPMLNLSMGVRGISQSYPSVSTFTFIATLLGELMDYNSIVFSNERSADFGNTTYRGLPVNHQWCKSTEAEKMINDYIQQYITPDISTHSLLRSYSELEIVRRFVHFPRYLPFVTSCNDYFWLPRHMQYMYRKGYWCKRCPKCVFLFACFSAFLPKQEVIKMFGANLYTRKRLLPLFRRILGIEGFKPLDCVGEPEEMILAMHYARRADEYDGELAMKLFEEYFPTSRDYANLEKSVFDAEAQPTFLQR